MGVYGASGCLMDNKLVYCLMIVMKSVSCIGRVYICLFIFHHSFKDILIKVNDITSKEAREPKHENKYIQTYGKTKLNLGYYMTTKQAY